MQFSIGLMIGVCLGHALRNRRAWHACLSRKIQLIALMRELKGYRIKRKRPHFTNWARFWLGWLHHTSPIFTRYMSVTPATLIDWHRHFCMSWWGWMSRPHRGGNKRGRPKLPEDLELLVLAIHTDNPGYGHNFRLTLKRANRLTIGS